MAARGPWGLRESHSPQFQDATADTSLGWHRWADNPRDHETTSRKVKGGRRVHIFGVRCHVPANGMDLGVEGAPPKQRQISEPEL